MKVNVKLLEKYYVCRSCGSENIKMYSDHGGPSCAYDCLDCKVGACNPRKMYKLKDDSLAKEVIGLYDNLMLRNNVPNKMYDGYLAKVIVIALKLKSGEKPVTKDVKRITYKNGELINIKLAK